VSRSFLKGNLGILVKGALASFGLYFCMYAFRKPFTVATYENISLFGVDYKILLILAQVVGYMLSKFIGIKVVSGLRNNQRRGYLTIMIFIAEISLILFGVLPKPLKVVMLFFNGLSLGMIWGIVFSYLEGRKTTEVLGIILCSSFIVSSGAVKSVGFWLINTFNTNQYWMPAATGALFLIPFFIFLFLLEKLPPPTEEDRKLRKERVPMNSLDRRNLVKQFFLPLVVLVIFYTALTALRDFRDNFSRELWDSIGFEGDASIYTLSEIPIAICVLLILGLFGFVKNNFKAFIGFHYLMLGAALLAGITTLMFQYGRISPVLWMITVGFGLYACYVPFNCIFFDRMIATFRLKGNAGFLIYIADSFGYLGSMGVLLYKNFGQANISWLQFFVWGIYGIVFMGMLALLVSLMYFKRKFQNNKSVYQLHIT
jgi:MFS family permease